MQYLCCPEELSEARGLLSGFVRRHSFTLGCLTALGVTLIEGGLDLLPPECRDDVIAELVNKLFDMRVIPESTVPDAAAIASFGRTITPRHEPDEWAKAA